MELDTSDCEALEIVVDYEEKYNQKIPIFVAGGIYTGKDIAKYVKQGASGVQMGTRFIATEECDAHEKYKDMFVKATKEDIVIVKSPAGFPGRAIRNKFTERLDKDGRIPVRYCVDCITGVQKELHVIDPSKCIKCGSCEAACPVNAINRTCFSTFSTTNTFVCNKKF